MSNIKDFIKNLSTSDLSQDEQLNLLSQVEQTIKEQKLKDQALLRKESMEKNVDYVVAALKKIETKLENKLAELNNTPARVGAQGPAGKDGKAGKDGRDGKDGFNGVSGKDGIDGKNGVDGQDGVSVIDAKVDFDGSLVVYLSNGSEIDCGQILSPDVAQNIIINSGGSGTSQAVTDTLASLQTQIDNIGGGSGSGTVTSVAATAGTGISVTGSPITSSGTLTITNTAPDQTVVLTAGTGISTSGTYPNFTITNTSPSSGGTVTSVSGTAPVVSSGGNTPAISMAAATTSVSGYLTSTDWNTFNGKQATLVSGTSIKTVNGTTLLGSGDLGVITGTYGGTGVNNGARTLTMAGSITYAGAFTQSFTATANTAVTLPTTGTLSTLAGTETLSNKTLTGTKETVFAITDGAAFEINPANGGIQTITLGAARTPKGTNFTAGQSVTLMITAGANAITWTDATFGTGGVKWVGASAPGSAPTLSSTAVSIVELWEVGTQTYGAFVGVA